MESRIKNEAGCWNKEVIEDHADSQTRKENANRIALPRNVVVDAGQIGCSGCFEGICTASISRTVIRPLGTAGEPIGPVLDELPLFERERPEADVIELRKDAA